jgi:hypothetical protein
MKLLVKTTGEFMLFDPTNGSWVQPDRPTVVPPSGFINSRAALGHVALLGQVNDDATDEAFLDTWNQAEKNEALAVDSFLSEFPLPPVAAAEEAPPAAVEPVEAQVKYQGSARRGRK